MSPVEEIRTRLAWVYPAEILAIEAKFAVPLYDKYRERGHPMMTGVHPIHEYDKVGRPNVNNDIYVSLDFKSYDATVPTFVIHEAFLIMSENICWTHWGGKNLTEGQQQRWRRVWQAMEYYFINTPILMPDGVKWTKHRGVPSGSFFTQIGDSVCNSIIIYACCNYLGLPCWGLRVLGDDSAFATTRAFSLPAVQEFFLFISMNVTEKTIPCEARGELKLLGYKLDNHTRAREDPIDWFMFALYPESCPESLDVSWSRIVGLMIAGGSYSDEFCQFVGHYQSGFPVQQEISLPSGMRRMLKYAHGIDVPPTFRVGSDLWAKLYTYIK